jgi:hypothetical protein
MRYDPNEPVDAAEWLALDEMEQQLIVERYHKRAHVQLPSSRMHAIMHAAIETQVADGRASTAKALDRMLAQGLDRHDAIHAVGSVLATHMYRVMKDKTPFDDKAYDADLDALSAERWRAESQED